MSPKCKRELHQDAKGSEEERMRYFLCHFEQGLWKQIPWYTRIKHPSYTGKLWLHRYRRHSGWEQFVGIDRSCCGSANVDACKNVATDAGRE